VKVAILTYFSDSEDIDLSKEVDEESDDEPLLVTADKKVKCESTIMESNSLSDNQLFQPVDRPCPSQKRLSNLRMISVCTLFYLLYTPRTHHMISAAPPESNIDDEEEEKQMQIKVGPPSKTRKRLRSPPYVAVPPKGKSIYDSMLFAMLIFVE